MRVRQESAVLKFFAGLALVGPLTMAQQSARVNPPSDIPATSIVESPKVPVNPADAGIGVTGVDAKSYIIGPEDLLNVSVWREPEFSGLKIVRPDGRISMPLIGEVMAQGQTPEGLSRQLAEALGEYINRPEVTVAVNQVNSKKFYIQGQVNRPGQFPLAVPTRIGDALSAAAGFKDFAKTKNIIIIRGNQRIRFNWDDYAKGKHLEQNILLENGDTILVQ